MLTIKKLEEVLRLGNMGSNYVSLAKLLGSIIFLSHLFACIWLIVANAQMHADPDKHTWQQSSSNFDFYDQKWYTQYLHAYYFITVIMCTVGFGDISPVNNIEVFICIITMFFASGLFAYAINSIGMIAQDIYQQEQINKKKLYTINQYMKNKKISFDLQYKIREYLEYFWKEQSQTNGELEQLIIDDLSDQLKDQLQLQANKIVLQDSPIFKTNFSDTFIQKCVHIIREIRFQPGQIIEQSIEDTGIYFIEQGSIEYYQEIKKKELEKETIALHILQHGDYFNHYPFFTGISQFYKIRSCEFTKVLMIKRHEFLLLLKEFPEDFEIFCQIKDVIAEHNDFEKIGSACVGCGKFTHDIQNCAFLHHIPNQYKIIRQFNMKDASQEKRDNFFNRNNCEKYKVWKQYKIVAEKGMEYFDENQSFIDDQSWVMTDQTDTTSSEESSEEDDDSQGFNGSQQQLNNNSLLEHVIEEDEQDLEESRQPRVQKRKQTAPQFDDPFAEPIVKNNPLRLLKQAAANEILKVYTPQIGNQNQKQVLQDKFTKYAQKSSNQMLSRKSSAFNITESSPRNSFSIKNKEISSPLKKPASFGNMMQQLIAEENEKQQIKQTNSYRTITPSQHAQNYQKNYNGLVTNNKQLEKRGSVEKFKRINSIASISKQITDSQELQYDRNSKKQSDISQSQISDNNLTANKIGSSTKINQIDSNINFDATSIENKIVQSVKLQEERKKSLQKSNDSSILSIEDALSEGASQSQSKTSSSNDSDSDDDSSVEISVAMSEEVQNVIIQKNDKGEEIISNPLGSQPIISEKQEDSDSSELTLSMESNIESVDFVQNVDNVKNMCNQIMQESKKSDDIIGGKKQQKKSSDEDHNNLSPIQQVQEDKFESSTHLKNNNKIDTIQININNKKNNNDKNNHSQSTQSQKNNYVLGTSDNDTQKLRKSIEMLDFGKKEEDSIMGGAINPNFGSLMEPKIAVSVYDENNKNKKYVSSDLNLSPSILNNSSKNNNISNHNHNHSTSIQSRKSLSKFEQSNNVGNRFSFNTNLQDQQLQVVQPSPNLVSPKDYYTHSHQNSQQLQQQRLSQKQQVHFAQNPLLKVSATSSKNQQETINIPIRKESGSPRLPSPRMSSRMSINNTNNTLQTPKMLKTPSHNQLMMGMSISKGSKGNMMNSNLSKGMQSSMASSMFNSNQSGKTLFGNKQKKKKNLFKPYEEPKTSKKKFKNLFAPSLGKSGGGLQISTGGGDMMGNSRYKQPMMINKRSSKIGGFDKGGMDPQSPTSLIVKQQQLLIQQLMAQQQNKPSQGGGGGGVIVEQIDNNPYLFSYEQQYMEDSQISKLQDFDRVKVYRKYFPNYNFERIKQKFEGSLHTKKKLNEAQTLQKSSNRRQSKLKKQLQQQTSNNTSKKNNKRGSFIVSNHRNASGFRNKVASLNQSGMTLSRPSITGNNNGVNINMPTLTSIEEGQSQQNIDDVIKSKSSIPKFESLDQSQQPIRKNANKKKTHKKTPSILDMIKNKAINQNNSYTGLPDEPMETDQSER